jgi:hypothetical protein
LGKELPYSLDKELVNPVPVCTLVKKLPYSLGKKLVYSASTLGKDPVYPVCTLGKELSYSLGKELVCTVSRERATLLFG